MQFRKSRAKKYRISEAGRVSERGAGVAVGFDDDDFDADSNLDTDTGEADEDGDEREADEGEAGRAGGEDGAGRPGDFFFCLFFSVLYRVALIAGHSRRGANLVSGFTW